MLRSLRGTKLPYSHRQVSINSDPPVNQAGFAAEMVYQIELISLEITV